MFPYRSFYCSLKSLSVQVSFPYHNIKHKVAQSVLCGVDPCQEDKWGKGGYRECAITVVTGVVE
jgi:hypothetical protein